MEESKEEGDLLATFAPLWEDVGGVDAEVEALGSGMDGDLP